MPGFPKLLRFQEHHDRILKKLLSRLFKNLVSVNFKHVHASIKTACTKAKVLEFFCLCLTYMY